MHENDKTCSEIVPACSVELGIKAQVPETALDRRGQRQCSKDHRLSFPGRSRRSVRHGQLATTDKQPETTMPRSADTTAQDRTSAGFRSTVPCHQG